MFRIITLIFVQVFCVSVLVFSGDDKQLEADIRAYPFYGTQVLPALEKTLAEAGLVKSKHTPFKVYWENDSSGKYFFVSIGYISADGSWFSSQIQINGKIIQEGDLSNPPRIKINEIGLRDQSP